jgi:hypothetical protein
MHATGKNDQYGEPDEWQFDYSWDILQNAFWLWSMSGFQRLPTQEEVMNYDPRYISDIRLMHMIYSHQGNNTAVMQLYQQWEAFQENPALYRARMEAEKATRSYDGKEEGQAQGRPSSSLNQIGARNGAANMGRVPRSAGELE